MYIICRFQNRIIHVCFIGNNLMKFRADLISKDETPTQKKPNKNTTKLKTLANVFKSSLYVQYFFISNIFFNTQLHFQHSNNWKTSSRQQIITDEHPCEWSSSSTLKSHVTKLFAEAYMRIKTVMQYFSSRGQRWVMDGFGLEEEINCVFVDHASAADTSHPSAKFIYFIFRWGGAIIYTHGTCPT